ANFSMDSVTVLDVDNQIAFNVSVGANPISIAVNPNLNKVYVANYQGNSVTIIEGRNDLTTTIPVGSNPISVVVNEATGKVYVSNKSDNTVTVIDGITNNTVTVAAGNSPRGIGVNPVTNKIYVANSESDDITVIDGETNTTHGVNVGDEPWVADVDPVRNRVFVVNHSGNSVTVIDGETEQTITVPVGNSPVDLAVNYHNNEVYVVNQNGNSVTIIDGLLFMKKNMNIGSTPSAVTLSRNTSLRNLVFVAESGSNALRILGEGFQVIDHPLATEIDTLNRHFTTDAMPVFTGQSTNSRSPNNSPIMKVLYSIDDIKGEWNEAHITSGVGTSSVLWQVDIEDSLHAGIHHIYAVAIDSTCGTIASFGDVIVNSPFTGEIACYAFYVMSAPNPNLFGACEDELFVGISDSTSDDNITKLNDLGMNGDFFAGDGIYTLQIFPTGAFDFGPGYQILRYSGYSSSEVPPLPGYDVPITFNPAQPVVILFDINRYEDGFIPKTNLVFQIIPPPPLTNWLPHYVAGECQTEFGCSADWDLNDTTLLMNDQGKNGDPTARDGIYTFRKICDAAGSYDFKVLQDSGSWQPQFTSVGYVWDAGDSANLSFTTTMDSQLVFIQTDMLTGRTRAGPAQTATSVSDGSGFAGTPDIGVGLWVNNSEQLMEMSIPLTYDSYYLNLNYVELKTDLFLDWEMLDIQTDETSGSIIMTMSDFLPPNNWLDAGGRQIAALHFSIEPFAEGQLLNVDTSVALAPYEFMTIYGEPMEPDFSFGTISVTDTTAPIVPELLSPADDAIVEDSTPTFVWGKVALLGFVNQTREAAYADGSQVTYILQYALDESFTSSVITIPDILDTAYTLPEYLALSDTIYYWRVEAIDLFGNRSGYQPAPFSFTVQIPITVFFDDINDCNLGDWTIGSGGTGYFVAGSSEYVTAPCGIEMVSQGASYAYGKTPDINLESAEYYKVRFNFMVPNLDNHWFIVMDNGHIHLVIDNNTDLKAWQGSNGGALFLKTLTTGQWYEVLCKVSPYIEQYDVFVDEDSIFRANFLNSEASSYLRIGDIHDGSYDHGEAFWDDLFVFGERSYVIGDADGSGFVDIDDVVFLIQYIFAGGPAPVPLDAGDAECSGFIDIDDVVYLINYIFAGGPAPGDPDNDGVPDC
ncbi:MAG: hypothetical protein ABIK83_02555, partial [Candidatus Zixiibacteriota bacterium]